MTDYTKSFETKAYWAPSPAAPLVPATITRRAPTDNDIVIEIEYAGICHSDIHMARNEWGPKTFPMVPGHEILGKIVHVGKNVSSKFQVGKRAGVGCMVDSCRSCRSCILGEENYCQEGLVGTYAANFKYAHCAEFNSEGGNVTYGGYSQAIVVDQKFALTIPDNLDPARAAPLLCAGITTYSPLIHFGLRPHHKFAVAGLGGLGHMAVKIGKAFGAHVTVLSRGQGKKTSAIDELGAHDYIDVTNPEDVKRATGTFDFIINTIAAKHDINFYINLLAIGGNMVLVGAPPESLDLNSFALIGGRRSVSASLIGGIKETQDMLDFCARNNIASDVEIIKAEQINEAYDRCVKSDVKYRFVIDVSTI